MSPIELESSSKMNYIESWNTVECTSDNIGYLEHASLSVARQVATDVVWYAEENLRKINAQTSKIPRRKNALLNYRRSWIQSWNANPRWTYRKGLVSQAKIEIRNLELE